MEKEKPHGVQQVPAFEVADEGRKNIAILLSIPRAINRQLEVEYAAKADNHKRYRKN
jgi:hypothetical protein